MDTDLWAAGINWIEWSRIGEAQNGRTGNEEDRKRYSDQVSAMAQNSKIFVFRRKSYDSGQRRLSVARQEGTFHG